MTLIAYILRRRSGAKVTLFEKEPQAGGHTLTDDSPGYPVDLGFQVLIVRNFNPRKHPIAPSPFGCVAPTQCLLGSGGLGAAGVQPHNIPQPGRAS